MTFVIAMSRGPTYALLLFALPNYRLAGAPRGEYLLRLALTVMAPIVLFTGLLDLRAVIRLGPFSEGCMGNSVGGAIVC